jgi:25S rRNA (uracil2843-N3)-methyltransferase
MVQNKVKDNRQPGRPGWKGPSFVPKAPGKHLNPHSKEARDAAAAAQPQWSLPVDLQQLLLNIFRYSFPDVLTDENLIPTLQEIKTALFERDFARAFREQRLLEAYAVRWSPSRALCYGSAFVDLREYFGDFPLFASGRIGGVKEKQTPHDILQGSKETPDGEVTRIICLGGCAAEVVALGGSLRYLLTESDEDVENNGSEDLEAVTEKLSLSRSADLASHKLDLHLVDSAPWSAAVKTLTQTLTNPPPLSKYASAHAIATNRSLIPPSSLSTTFHQHDLLSLTVSSLKAITTTAPCILTLLFTLNELYTSSISKTTAFLLRLTEATAKGSVLVVIDSPGSYSEATIGSEQKSYPMQWLLDHTLVEKLKFEKAKRDARLAREAKEVKKVVKAKQGEQTDAGAAKILAEKENLKGKNEADVDLEFDEDGPDPMAPKWEKLLGDEARWFRLPENLRYPISLENMRYQVHVFRRL